jgi:hypothetical protein
MQSIKSFPNDSKTITQIIDVNFQHQVRNKVILWLRFNNQLHLQLHNRLNTVILSFLLRERDRPSFIIRCLLRTA